MSFTCYLYIRSSILVRVFVRLFVRSFFRSSVSLFVRSSVSSFLRLFFRSSVRSLVRSFVRSFISRTLVLVCNKMNRSLISGIVITAYSPLGSPDRPYPNKEALPVLLNDPVLKEIPKKHTTTVALVRFLRQYK